MTVSSKCLIRSRFQGRYPCKYLHGGSLEITLTELKTLEWDILNPVLLINLEINNERIASIN